MLISFIVLPEAEMMPYPMMSVPGSIPKMIFGAFCNVGVNFTGITTGLNKNIKIIVNYVLGPLLFLLLSWSLYHQVMKQPDLLFRWKQIKSTFNDYRWTVVIVLMFFNWGMES